MSHHHEGFSPVLQVLFTMKCPSTASLSHALIPLLMNLGDNGHCNAHHAPNLVPTNGCGSGTVRFLTDCSHGEERLYKRGGGTYSVNYDRTWHPVRRRAE
jgi:hypothetical protein